MLIVACGSQAHWLCIIRANPTREHLKPPQTIRPVGRCMAKRVQMSEGEANQGLGVDQALSTNQTLLKRALTCLGRVKECRRRVKMDYECISDLTECIKDSLDAADEWINATEEACNQLVKDQENQAIALRDVKREAIRRQREEQNKALDGEFDRKSQEVAVGDVDEEACPQRGGGGGGGGVISDL